MFKFTKLLKIVKRNESDSGLIPINITYQKESIVVMYKTKVDYLELCPPVPLGTSGDEKSPSLTSDPAGSKPANTHLFQVFFEGASPSLLIHHSLSSAVFVYQVYCCRCGSSTLQLENVARHFPSSRADNVMESLHTCSSHHLFICDMVAP